MPNWEAQPGSQFLALTCPYEEIFVEGTRGGGKSILILMKYLQHVGKGLGMDWQGIIFRRTYPELHDIVLKSRKMFADCFPDAEYNRSTHTWTFAGGEQLLFRHMRNSEDYWSYHGHEYPFQAFEEMCSWPDLECWNEMRSCSRSSNPDVPIVRMGTANPYGVGHNAVKAHWIDPAPAGTPITDPDTGMVRVRLHSHWSENKKLMEADPDYIKRLMADDNEARQKAWLDGDWNIVAGGMFDDVWDQRVHIVKPFPIPSSWRIYRSFDWGSSKPFSVGWWAETDGTPDPRGRPLAPKSLFRIGEWYGWTGKPNEGLKMDRKDIARRIVKLEGALGIAGRCRPGPADSSIFYAEEGRASIAVDMAYAGARFIPADKRPGSRVVGWEKMRAMLRAALEGNVEERSMFVFNRCRDGFIRTVPALPRDKVKLDDVDTDAEDHTGDEVRYMATMPRQEAKAVTWRL